MSLFNVDKIPAKYRELGKIEYIGHGSIGTVFKISGSSIDYALKVMDCGKNDGKYRIAKKEVEVLEQLKGAQHIVDVFDTSEVEINDGKTVFVLEEYGVLMPEYIKNTDISISGALRIVIGIADAILECEKRGVVHLDIQPNNIFLNQSGQVMVGDFNSALFLNELGIEKRKRGTLSFMAPEVYRKGECSITSDIYSLGVLMYWLLNNEEIPFLSDDKDEVAIYKRLAGTVFPELKAINEDVRTELELIVNRACAYEKSERYSGIETFRDDLTKLWERFDKGELSDAIIEKKQDETEIDWDRDFPVTTGKTILPIIMPPIQNKKTQVVCILLDLSKENEGKNAALVNMAMQEIFCEIREIEEKNSNIEIRVAIFNTADEKIWISKPNTSECIDDIFWSAQESDGKSQIGRTLAELNRALSRNVLFNDVGKKTCPVILYLGNGESFDDWRTELDNLSKNRWFTNSTRIAIRLEDTDNEFMEAFASNGRESILSIEDVKDISLSLNYVTIHSVALDLPSKGEEHNHEWLSGNSNDDYHGQASTLPSELPFDAPYRDSSSFEAFDADPIATSEALWNTDSLAVPSGKWAGGNNDVPSGGFHGYNNTVNQTPCANCGHLVGDEKFCPNCGTKVVRESSGLKVSKVNFSAVAPTSVAKGEYSLIDVIMYEEQFKKIVDDIIAQSETEVKETKSSAVKVVENAKIKMIISTPDFEIQDDTEERKWIGEYLDFSFSVIVPERLEKTQILFTITVFINNIMSTRLKFTAKVTDSKEKQEMDIYREDIKSAFVSFAKEDKNRALRIIQGVQLIRPDMDIFMDADTIRLRKDYDYSVKKEIDYRDVFYLCWSGFAKRSKQVELEWRYALEKKGITGIETLPLEFPDNCPPPVELQNKHFNDKIFIHMTKNSVAIDNDKVQINKNLYLDKGARAASMRGRTIKLTKLEYLVLECLSNNIGRILNNDTLARYAWGEDYFEGMGDDSNVRRIIKQLRSKLGDGVIENSPGLGYRISKEQFLSNHLGDPFLDLDW